MNYDVKYRDKIVFVIFKLTKNNGGHHYDLKDYYDYLKINSKYVLDVINIGIENYDLIDNIHNIKIKKNRLLVIQFITILRKLRKIIDRRTLCIFCLDIHSYLFVRILNIFVNKKVFLVKCGGGNPKRYFPFSQNMILFSKENLKYFKHSVKFTKSKLIYYPNRINYFNYNESKIKKILHNNISINIIRITRISKTYIKSIHQTICLSKYLQKSGHSTNIYIIGEIQDSGLLEKLVSQYGSYVNFINDNELSKNAREIIRFADIVVGTGRGAMEAASKGKIVYCPVNCMELPILLYNETEEKLLETNLSGRAKFSKQEIIDGIDLTNQLIDNISEREKYSKYIELLANKKFLLNKRIIEISNDNNTHKVENYGDMLLHILFTYNRIKKVI